MGVVVALFGWCVMLVLGLTGAALVARWLAMQARRVTVRTSDGGRMVFPDAVSAAEYARRMNPVVVQVDAPVVPLRKLR